MLKNVLSTLLISCLIGFSSCKKDDNYTVPTTYNFDNVDYSGQTDRIKMLAEMTTYMKSAHDNGAAALDAQKLKNMYSTTNSPFTDAALNGSTKQLKSKTYPNEDTKFELYIDSLAAASQHTSKTAANGQAGIGVSGTSKYLFNAKGFELTQLIEKGLAGACFYYQATSVYFGSGQMDVDNENVVTGKGTNMEHHWDEAFGYFGAPIDFPTNTTGLGLWAKYCNGRNGLLGTNAGVMDAFLKGRAAISNKDLTTRDEQITEVRKYWEQVVAATAIHYLNGGKTSIGAGDEPKKLHELSEAYTFIMCLKYGTGVNGITNAQVDGILSSLAGSADPLQANIYTITETKINTAIDAIVGYVPALESHKGSL